MRKAKAAASVTAPPLCKRISRKPLTTAETGCALSHIHALEYVTRSAAKSVLILEDDVLGADRSIDTVASIAMRLPDHHFLLCGGQDGLRGRHYLRGKKEAPDYFRLPPMMLRFASRACAYAVSPSMATAILQQQRTCLDRADNWRMLLYAQKALYFTNCLHHPRDTVDSHLENGRTVEKQNPFIWRAWNDGLGYTLSTQTIKLLIPPTALMLGWKRLF